MKIQLIHDKSHHHETHTWTLVEIERISYRRPRSGPGAVPPVPETHHMTEIGIRSRVRPPSGAVALWVPREGCDDRTIYFYQNIPVLELHDAVSNWLKQRDEDRLRTLQRMARDEKRRQDDRRDALNYAITALRPVTTADQLVFPAAEVIREYINPFDQRRDEDQFSSLRGHDIHFAADKAMELWKRMTALPPALPPEPELPPALPPEQEVQRFQIVTHNQIRCLNPLPNRSTDVTLDDGTEATIIEPPEQK